MLPRAVVLGTPAFDVLVLTTLTAGPQAAPKQADGDADPSAATFVALSVIKKPWSLKLFVTVSQPTGSVFVIGNPRSSQAVMVSTPRPPGEDCEDGEGVAGRNEVGVEFGTV